MLRAGLLATGKDGSPDWQTRMRCEQRLADMYGWRKGKRGRPMGRKRAVRASQPGEKPSSGSMPAWLAAHGAPSEPTPPKPD